MRLALNITAAVLALPGLILLVAALVLLAIPVVMAYRSIEAWAA